MFLEVTFYNPLNLLRLWHTLLLCVCWCFVWSTFNILVPSLALFNIFNLSDWYVLGIFFLFVASLKIFRIFDDSFQSFPFGSIWWWSFLLFARLSCLFYLFFILLLLILVLVEIFFKPLLPWSWAVLMVYSSPYKFRYEHQ